MRGVNRQNAALDSRGKSMLPLDLVYVMIDLCFRTIRDYPSSWLAVSRNSYKPLAINASIRRLSEQPMIVIQARLINATIFA